jgi:hypothetical protein
MPPSDLQTEFNSIRLRREAVLGDAGTGASDTIKARITSASATRDVAGMQERIGPFRTREFHDVIHAAYELELTGELRSGAFLRWLLESITVAGTAERGLDVLFVPWYASGLVNTMAIQVNGIDGVTTYAGAALKSLKIDFRGRRVITWAATFAALKKTRAAAGTAWEETEEETGTLFTSSGSDSGSRISLAADLGTLPDTFEETAYEASIEILWPELVPSNFNADGVAQSFSRSESWDVTGRILLPETSGITDLAGETRWNGEINLAAVSLGTGERFEIEAGVIAMVDRRTLLARDWKQVQLDFVSRRASNEPILKFLTNIASF